MKLEETFIKGINHNKKPVVIKPTKSDEKEAVMISQDDWKAIEETLFLVNNGVDEQIRQRANDEEDFDQVWNKL